MVLDKLAIATELRDLNDRYAACLDGMELEDWAAMFVEDGFYQIIARENYDRGLTHATVWCKGAAMLRDRVLAIREALVFEDRSLRHMVSAVRVNGVEGDVISAQANFYLVESMIDAKPEMVLLGRYVDRVVRTSEGLKFLERTCVFDNHWLPRALIIPV